MTYPTRKNLVVAISPTPYDKPLLVDLVPADATFFLGVDVATSNPNGVALVGKGGAGGPYTYTCVAGTAASSGFEPAPGVTLNPDGTITGTPATQGVFSFVAQVEDVGSNTHDASFSINVQSGLIPVVFQPTIGEEAVPYRFAFIVRDLTGTTVPSGYTVSVGTLPGGLSMSGAGVVSGTPTAPAVGVTQVTINVTYLGMSLDIPCTFTVADAVTLTFVEDRDPPNGWGGGPGSWLPSIIRGVDYIANLVITGGVPPYSLTPSVVDPLPTGVNLVPSSLYIRGKTEDVAAPSPILIAVLVTDAVGGNDLAQRAMFIIDAQQGRIQPQLNTVDVSGGNGPLKLNLIEGANVSIVATNDGDTMGFEISAHPSSGSDTINGVHPDSSGNWQISGITVDSNGNLVIHGGSTYTPPVTTKGDLFGFSTVPARVPVGTDGQIIRADSTQATGLKYGDELADNPGCTFTNGNLVLTGTLKGRRSIQAACKIIGWAIVGDPGVSGNASIAVGHSTLAAYGTITSLFTATVTSADHSSASGLTNALAAGDVIYFTGSGWSLFTNVTITLYLGPP